jgi:hypothetical protein
MVLSASRRCIRGSVADSIRSYAESPSELTAARAALRWIVALARGLHDALQQPCDAGQSRVNRGSDRHGAQGGAGLVALALAGVALVAAGLVFAGVALPAAGFTAGLLASLAAAGC